MGKVVSMGRRNTSANLRLGGVWHEHWTYLDDNARAARRVLAAIKAGESVLCVIGALGQRRGNVHRLLEASGGIAPVPRVRSQKVSKFGEREEISRAFRAIARGLLSRSVSTVSQEVARHGGRGRYRAALMPIWRLGSRPR